MRKVVQCIPLKTMTAIAVLEDIANGAIRRDWGFTGVPSNRGIPEGAVQPIGTVPVDPAEPCQPCGTELSASQPGISNSHTMQLNRPTLKRNLKREPVFLM